jgi:hypothetical protein
MTELNENENIEHIFASSFSRLGLGYMHKSRIKVYQKQMRNMEIVNFLRLRLIIEFRIQISQQNDCFL